jgi:hypothetical protein
MADSAAWIATFDWPSLNLRLSRVVDLLQFGQRTVCSAIAADTTLRSVSGIPVVTINGTFTLTLPPATVWKGQQIVVKHGSGAATATTAASAGETIDGSATMAWTTVNEARRFTSDGAAILRIG